MKSILFALFFLFQLCLFSNDAIASHASSRLLKLQGPFFDVVQNQAIPSKGHQVLAIPLGDHLDEAIQQTQYWDALTSQLKQTQKGTKTQWNAIVFHRRSLNETEFEQAVAAAWAKEHFPQLEEVYCLQCNGTAKAIQKVFTDAKVTMGPPAPQSPAINAAATAAPASSIPRIRETLLTKNDRVLQTPKFRGVSRSTATNVDGTTGVLLRSWKKGEQVRSPQKALSGKILGLDVDGTLLKDSFDDVIGKTTDDGEYLLFDTLDVNLTAKEQAKAYDDIKDHIRPAFKTLIRDNPGAHVLLISAGTDNYIAKVAKALSEVLPERTVHCLSECQGPTKLQALLEVVDPKKSKLRVFGDTVGDANMIFPDEGVFRDHAGWFLTYGLPYELNYVTKDGTRISRMPDIHDTFDKRSLQHELPQLGDIFSPNPKKRGGADNGTDAAPSAGSINSTIADIPTGVFEGKLPQPPASTPSAQSTFTFELLPAAASPAASAWSPNSSFHFTLGQFSIGTGGKQPSSKAAPATTVSAFAGMKQSPQMTLYTGEHTILKTKKSRGNHPTSSNSTTPPSDHDSVLLRSWQNGKTVQTPSKEETTQGEWLVFGLRELFDPKKRLDSKIINEIQQFPVRSRAHTSVHENIQNTLNLSFIKHLSDNPKLQPLLVTGALDAQAANIVEALTSDSRLNKRTIHCISECGPVETKMAALSEVFKIVQPADEVVQMPEALQRKTVQFNPIQTSLLKPLVSKKKESESSVIAILQELDNTEAFPVYD